MDYPTEKNNFLVEHILDLTRSYRNLLSRDLVSPALSNTELAHYLFHAPFALVSHNTAADPIFNYANLTALTLFELSWTDFTQLPSRLSAEPINQATREQLLARVTQNGYIDNYAGIRIASTGKRFLIKNATVWNVYDDKQIGKGQAAAFACWEFLPFCA